MQVWRRDDCFAGAQGIRKCAGNDLRLMLVGRDVNIRRADQFHHLLGAHETIAKDHIGLNS